jgi:aconitate hydratase
MEMNITKKILQNHLMEGSMSQGRFITIQVDQTLCHDLTGIMVAQILESVQVDKVSTETSVFYCDHNTQTVSSENSDDHLYLKTAAQRFGIYFSKPGNGICHFLHCQRFAKPGEVMIGADSHSPTSGALGMLSIGSGGLSVAKCMVGEGFKLKIPKILNVVLRGALKPGVSSKDIAFELLRILTVKGGIGHILEFTGSGLDGLSVPQRATIANMSIELGATTAIFPSDQITHDFLKAQQREADWIELKPDPGAGYDKTIEIDLNALEPLVAKPHMPDQVVKAGEVHDVAVDSVFIGSCTNASYSDILKSSKILKNRKVHPDVDLTIAPGSRQVLMHLINDGILSDLVVAGGRILECACGPCIGVGQVPFENGVAVRTSNRNFQGRSGTNKASVYLASPETAAATAIAGKITDPRDIFDVDQLRYSQEPKEYKIDDSMIIKPEDVPDPKAVEIIRGENIAPLPQGSPLRPVIEATVVIKLGDDITTDDIIPANSEILKYIANIPKFAEYTFHYTDPTFVQRIKKMDFSIIIGGENYGQGSSREHAALLPMFFGVEAVIAKSFARIHKENLINYGILPLTFKNKEDYEKIDANDVLVIDAVISSGIDNGEIAITIKNKNIVFDTILEIADSDKMIIKYGGTLNYLRDKLKKQKSSNG